MIVEAHTVGQDDWTTLPDLNGGTSTTRAGRSARPASTSAMHPLLEHYLTVADPCLPTGTTGRWNSFTGIRRLAPVAFDLRPYAGQQVEVVDQPTSPTRSPAGPASSSTTPG